MSKKTQSSSSKAYYARNKGKPSKRTGHRKTKNNPVISHRVTTACGGHADILKTPIKPFVKVSEHLGNVYALLDRKITEATAKCDKNKNIGFQRMSEPKNKHKRALLKLSPL